jgi:hypothetical protein
VARDFGLHPEKDCGRPQVLRFNRSRHLMAQGWSRGNTWTARISSNW